MNTIAATATPGDATGRLAFQESWGLWRRALALLLRSAVLLLLAFAYHAVHLAVSPREDLKPMETLTRSGLFGPWDAPDLGTLPAGINPGRAKWWGMDSFQLWPNFVILIWERNWYLTYHYWPTSHNTHVFEGNLYFVPARNARERLAQEMAAVTFKEFGLQDGNTLEATQIMLESRVVKAFPLNDQEILCRHLHKVTADWVNDYVRKRAEA